LQTKSQGRKFLWPLKAALRAKRDSQRRDERAEVFFFEQEFSRSADAN
jgi:hypothetical protein